MHILDQEIKKIHESLKNNEITIEELVEESNKRIRDCQTLCNAFVMTIEKPETGEPKEHILSGIPYALKDNLATKGMTTTASSNILKDFVPVYDSTTYAKLKDANAIMMAKSVLDELAMGGTGTTGHTGTVLNPWNPKYLIGGSSAGSAAAVAYGAVPFAIGSDTGDSIRKPAGFGGVVGFKPSWGLVSRFGLFPFACSLDHVGCFTRYVKDAAYVVDAIKGYDEKDMTSLEDTSSLVEQISGEVSGKKLFYIKELVDMTSEDVELNQTLANFKQVIDTCKNLGMTVDAVSVNKDLLNALFPTYISISSAESTSNNSNLTGVVFGSREPGDTIDDLMMNTRTKGFSELIKRRFVLGSYILHKENQELLFLNAKRVRRMIVNQMNELFKEYDAMIAPNSGGHAPLIGGMMDKLSDRYLTLENHLVIGNFGGFPSITIPSGFVENLPIAINITGPVLKDGEVLNIAYALEQSMGYAGLSVMNRGEQA